MSSELPEIDNSNAYVVDEGETVGPLVLGEIVRSIADGERSESVYVWWSGAGEWVRFNSQDFLLEMLDEIDAAREIDLRTEADEPPRSEPDLSEIALVKETRLAALTALGERLEALASATRHFATSSKLDRAGATPIGRQVLLDSEPAAGFDHATSKVRSDNLASTFDALLSKNLEYERLSEQSHRVLELLARACVASIGRRGFMVQASSETPGHHHVVLVDEGEQRQVQLAFTPAPSVGGGESQYVVLKAQWGQAPVDIDLAAKIVNSELPVAPRSTGTISTEIDLEHCHAMTSIDLVWPIRDYVGDDFELDHDALHASLDAIERALQQRWYELFTADD